MTTNQTIDGVPRELRDLLERVATEANHMLGFTYAANYDECRSAVDELRALLDAPVNPLSEIEVLRSAVKELEALRDARVDAKLAQPQGHPVAWYTDDHLTDKSATTYDLATMERWKAKGWPVTPMYLNATSPAALLGKGFTTLESGDGKYRIITSYQNRDDAWSDYTALCKAERPAPVAVFDYGLALESLAKQVYDSWESQPGFVPWVDGGNSAKQDEARQIASRTFELALANQVEDLP